VASWGTAVSGLQQGLNMGRPFIFVGRFCSISRAIRACRAAAGGNRVGGGAPKPMTAAKRASRREVVPMSGGDRLISSVYRAAQGYYDFFGDLILELIE